MIHNVFRIGEATSHWTKRAPVDWEATVHSEQMGCLVHWQLYPVMVDFQTHWKVIASAMPEVVCFTCTVTTLDAALTAIGRVSRGYDAPLEPEWYPDGVRPKQ